MSPAPEKYVLVFENIGKTFREKNGKTTHALDNANLELRPGSITALVGPDGAGKTTLLRIAAGLLTSDEGTFSLFGEKVRGNSASAFSRIGYMPQKFGLYEDLSVQENLDLYADLRGLEAGDREGRYTELLKMTGLSKFTDRLAGQLSGGMKQKLGLICTLVKAPDILLLDEPTVGVDPLSRRELWDIIKALTAKEKTSLIVSTSYLDEAARCDEVLLLFEGKILAKETPDALKSRSKSGNLEDSFMFLLQEAKGMEGEDTVVPREDRPKAAPEGLFPSGGAIRESRAEMEQAEVLSAQRFTPDTVVAREAEQAEVRSAQRFTPDTVAKDPPSGDESPSPRAKNGTSEPIIETKNVTKKFGDFTAVNDVSFSVFQGEVFGLLGPNGAGKTTTFRMLCGLLPATSGSLHVAGVDVRAARSDARRRIGYVAQKFSLYGLLTVRENLEFFAGAYGLTGKEREERITAVLEDFSLTKHIDSAAENLPGGNKQRLAMAAGLLHQPQILFLDEPTSGADPLARREFWLRISSLASSGVTIIVTTHFMEEAEYCDRILIQDSGVMLALDTPAAIRKKTGAPNMEEAFIRIVEKARQANGNGSVA